MSSGDGPRRLSAQRCRAWSPQERVLRAWKEEPADFVPLPRTHCYDLETSIEPPDDAAPLGEIQNLLPGATLSPCPSTGGMRLRHTSLRAPEHLSLTIITHTSKSPVRRYTPFGQGPCLIPVCGPSTWHHARTGRYKNIMHGINEWSNELTQEKNKYLFVKMFLKGHMMYLDQSSFNSKQRTHSYGVMRRVEKVKTDRV